jgi:D-alanyl-D-alanine dipeptidase
MMSLSMHSKAAPAVALALLSTPLPALAEPPMPAAFVDVATVVEGLVVDMRYFGSDNFVGRPIDGYEAPRCFLARSAAAALAAVQRDLAARGYGLKVFDCYRPTRAVAHFVRWARDVNDVARKAEHYPDVDKRDLFRLGYIATRSGHSRGATVDLTLVTRSGAAVEDVDMGTPFDFFSPKSWPTDTSVSQEAQRNRALLTGAMRRAGFAPYDKEWWHFTLSNEPFPSTYFDFPVR